MTNTTTVRIEGGENLLKELAALGGNVRSTARTAMRNGAKVVQAQAESNAAPLGRPAKHTRIQSTSLMSGVITMAVSPSKKKWWFRYFETGVTRHEITGGPLVFEGRAGLVVIGSVSHPGMAAHPWLRPAMDEKSSAAVVAIGETFKRAIEARRAIVESGEEEDV